MAKKITIWSMKGGVGKTNIALELALRIPASIITNEMYTSLSNVLGADRLLILDTGDEVPNIDGHDIIFDFGGYLDKRIVDAVKQSDYVFIPTIPETSDIQSCIDTIEEIKKYNQKIVIIANKTEAKGDFENVKGAISEVGDYPIFEVKKSRALPNIFITRQPIGKMQENNPLLRYSYQKIDKQFNNIINFIQKE